MGALPIRCERTQWLGMPSAGTLAQATMPDEAQPFLDAWAGQVQMIYRRKITEFFCEIP